MVVIWDLVVLFDPKKEAELDNVKYIIEIKFSGDRYTKNQKRAKQEVAVNSKLRTIKEKQCSCQPKEEEDNESVENTIKLLIILLLLKGRGVPKLPLPRPQPIPVH